MTSTPLRDLHVDAGGYTRLRGERGLDGAASPDGLAALLTRSRHLASWDPRLVNAATSSEELLEVEPARANILRSLSIDPASIVLEIGAGAGAVSRYLGETAALVDTIEARGDLAAIAADRLSDLDSVRVFGGIIADVPAEPVYDLIVAIDQLRVERQVAHAWLTDVRSRLAPGGALVLAETNRLGTKYFMGAPDDASREVFDSIEGYPRGNQNQALTRSQMVELLDGAGFISQVLAALPDHRSTRVVLDPSRLGDEFLSLASDLAITPAPDYFASRPKLADESKVWQQVVAAGLTGELANSFLIIATAEGGGTLWEPDRLASFHSWQRSANYTSQTEVRLDSRGAVVSRHYPQADPSVSPSVEDSSYRYVPGQTLAKAMETASDEQIASWLARWRDVVSEFADRGQLWVDLHPGNVILGDSGQLTPIDLEFEVPGRDTDFTIRRGLLVLARTLAAAVHPSHWSSEISTVGDIALKLGELMGFGADRRWLDSTLDDEARFQQTVAGTRAVGKTREEWRKELELIVNTPRDDLPLGVRVHEAVERIAAERDAAREQVGESDKRARDREDYLQLESSRRATALSNHIAALESRVHEQSEAIYRAHLADLGLRSSRAFRLASRLEAIAGAALPFGSRQRMVVSRFLAKVRAIFR